MIRSYAPALPSANLRQRIGALILWVGQACAWTLSVLGFASADDFRLRPLLISISLVLASVFILAIPVFSQWRQKEKFTSQLKGFRESIVNVSPTTLGWLVFGEDWIGTTVYPSGFKKILFSEIDDVFWGAPQGRWDQLGKTHSFKLPTDSIKQNTRCFWMVLSCSHDPLKNVVCTFRNQRTRDHWLKICKDLVEKGTSPELDQTQTWPSTKQVLWKTKIPSVCFRWSVLSLLSILALVAYVYHWKHLGGFSALWWLIFFSTGPFLDSSRNLYLAFEGSFAGLAEAKERGTPILDNGKLYLSIERDGIAFPEIIPVEKIRDMRLDQWGTVFTNRDLLQLFKRNAKPIYRTLVLVLDDEDQSQRRIQVGADQAEELYAKLLAERSPTQHETRSNSS